MKAELYQGKIIVVPETELEASLLYSVYRQGVSHSAFVKTGMSVEDRLGDVLWNLTALSYEVGFDLETIAIRNMEKLKERQAKGTIHGSGDDR